MTNHRKVPKERKCVCGQEMTFNYATGKWDCVEMDI